MTPLALFAPWFATAFFDWPKIGILSDPSRTFGPSEFSTWPILHPWAPGALLGLLGPPWALLGTSLGPPWASLGLLRSFYIHKLPINRTSGRYLYIM